MHALQAAVEHMKHQLIAGNHYLLATAAAVTVDREVELHQVLIVHGGLDEAVPQWALQLWAARSCWLLFIHCTHEPQHEWWVRCLQLQRGYVHGSTCMQASLLLSQVVTNRHAGSACTRSSDLGHLVSKIGVHAHTHVRCRWPSTSYDGT